MITPVQEAVPHSDHELDLLAAARDLWPAGTLDMWQGRASPKPARVWWPEDDEQVAKVLEAAARLGVEVVPYGAGSGVCGGARGRPGAWVIDTKRLDRIGRVDEAHWTIEVEAGVNGQHLEDALEAQGYTLGHSPSSIWCSTVGGWAAARSAGQFSSRYGVFEDMVLGLDAVAPGIGAFYVGLPGESSPAQEAPEGWMPLLLGSEGTLAIITRLRLRVRRAPEVRWLRGYAFDGVESALAVMRALMQQELWPAVVRLYDPIDTLVGGKTRPKRAGGHGKAWWKAWLKAVDELSEVRRRSLVLPLALPGLLQQLGEGLSRECLLVLGWEGAPDVVAAASEAGHRIACEGGRDLGVEPGERWFAARHAVSYKLMPVFERGGFADTMEVAARWSQVPGVYAAVREALRGHVLVMAHLSHVYPEGGSIYFSFAGRGEREVYEATWRAAMEAVLHAGGTITHHHGVGLLKAAAVSREVGPAVEGWRALKRALDPGRLLNPGRVYVDVERAPPVPERCEDGRDGLAWVPARCDAPTLRRSLPVEEEARWAWSGLPGPPRWQREAWQTTWVELRGQVDGVPVALGRGPRSASGSDLRGWLADHDAGALASVAVVPRGQGWMGEARVERPWAVAQALLRADLRPAVLGVVDGVLRVGFRGPAAAAFGALASRHVPGGLTARSWAPVSSGARPGLVPTTTDDPEVVHVTTEWAWRPPAGEGIP
jgi:alkyldihydroxyacetonephosphate synthase